MGKEDFIGRDLIERIEEVRESKVIVYFTGDRVPFPARIAEDAVRPLYDHLLGLGSSKVERIDLFLYSRGGDISVPWRIVSMIREFCDEFNVLIPYKAQSAATLLSLGADNIVRQHRNGEESGARTHRPDSRKSGQWGEHDTP